LRRSTTRRRPSTKARILAARRPGDPNPFVVGQENYQKFLDVMSLCTQVNIARRK